MNNIYFLDTSYILALEISNETSHRIVLGNWKAIAKSKPILVTTTYIFVHKKRVTRLERATFTLGR